MVRVLGLEMEKQYGENITTLDDISPNFDIEATSGNFALNDDPNLSNGGSRTYKHARAGVMKPTGSNEFDVDLETIGHFLRAFLDQYQYTNGSGEFNTHEFYGGESRELPSWKLRAIYDIFGKGISGAICDALNLEVSDEKMTASVDWIYKTEFAEYIDENTFEAILLDCIIPIMFYDVSIKLNNQVPAGVVRSFSFEGSNNHNVDGTIGLGSRHPQTRALAQLREGSLSVTTTLTRDTLRSILDGEYGEVDAMSPSECKIRAIPLELDIALCEDPNRQLSILFPKCVLNVEYSWDGTEDIEATINMTALGTGTATKLDGTEVTTDMYCRLVNSQDEINANDPADTADIQVSSISGVTVTLTNTTDSTKVYTRTTGSAGGCMFNNIPYGPYTVGATKTGYTNYTGTLTVSASTTELDIEMTEE